MASRSVKQLLAADIGSWLSDGIIDQDKYETLSKRYQTEELGFNNFLRSLGMTSGVFSLIGFLGMIAALSGSEEFGILICLGGAALCLYYGLKLAKDPLDRSPQGARTLLTFGMLLFLGSLGLFAHTAKMSQNQLILFVGGIWVPATFVLAYYTGNAFLLTLSLLGLFHWVGSFSEMLGRSTYALAIQDPRVMAVVAVAATVTGFLHDKPTVAYAERFSKVYIAIGLFYLNSSLLILSLRGVHHEGRQIYMALGFLACIAQLLIGARTGRPQVTAYGMTFAGIHIFTRYHELFWDRFDKGVFFLVGGILLLGLGLLFERLLRAQQNELAPEKTKSEPAEVRHE